MIKKFKKILSVLTASALTTTLAASIPSVSAEDVSVEVEVGTTVEAESLGLNGTTVWTDIYGQQFPGYSGEGFVYMTSGNITFEVNAPADGMYDISVRYVQILDKTAREQSILVNGQKKLIPFPYADEWTDKSFGSFRLKEGKNTIQLTVEYGYAGYDTITVKEAEFPDLTVDPVLADKNATIEAKGLMKYLCDIYGEHMLSGQQEIYGGGHTADSPNGYQGDDLKGYESEFEWIKKNFGVYPAIRGFDLMNFNPLYGWDDGTTGRMIEWGEKGGIPTVCWHINLPNDFDNYEVGEEVSWEVCSYKPNSSFSVANATIEGTKEYEYVQLATKYLAEELLKVQEAGVPVIFRPYHEAQGNYDGKEGTAWFWWGQDGPEAYVALWKQLYTDLTEKYGLHNLIWEFNSYLINTYEQWYPGDEYVDIVGFDKYNTVYNRFDGKTEGPNEDAISDTFYKLVDLTDGKKLVSMPENDTVPSLANIMTEKAYWLYFCIWYDNGQDNFLSGSNKNNPETLKEMYQSDFCITLDELPEDWATYAGSDDVDPTEPTEPSETDPTETSEADPTVPSTTEPSATDPTEPSVTDPTEPSTTEPSITDPTKPSTTEPSVTDPTEEDTLPSYTGTDELTYGDVDLNGAVAVADIVCLSKHLTNKTINSLGKGDAETEAKATEQADVNYDRVINNTDLSILVEYALGSITLDNLGPQK